MKRARSQVARWGRCEVLDALKPAASDLMLLVVFPQQRREHIHIERQPHGVRLSNSLTRCKVVMPFSLRMTGNPFLPVATEKRGREGGAWVTTS